MSKNCKHVYIFIYNNIGEKTLICESCEERVEIEELLNRIERRIEVLEKYASEIATSQGSSQ